MLGGLRRERSRRLSSRSTWRRTSSGSAIASSCSRSSLASAADSSNSPSSLRIASSCWRSTNSRWPLSISDWTWVWISVPIEMTSSSRARISDEPAQALGDVDLLEQPLLLLGLQPQRARDEVAQRARVVDVGDRELELLGQVGDVLDDARERLPGRCGSAPRARSTRSTVSGSSSISRREVGRLAAPSSSIRTRWAPWTRIRSVPSGTLSMRAIDADDADACRGRRARAPRARGRFEATMTSMRSPASTSLTSWIERSWPIASGVSVSGSGTASRSGRTGSAPGTARWRADLDRRGPRRRRRPRSRVARSTSSPSRDLDRHAARARLGRASGSSMRRMPSR